MDELPIIEVPCCYNCGCHIQQKNGSDYCYEYEIDVSPDWYCLKWIVDEEEPEVG